MPNSNHKCPKCKNILLDKLEGYNPPLLNCSGCGGTFMVENPPKQVKPRWDATYGEDADRRAMAEKKAEDKQFSSLDGTEIPPETPAEYWNRLPPFVNEKYPESMWTRDRIISSDGRPATIDPNKRFEEHSEADQKWIEKEIQELTKDDEEDMARGFNEAKRLSEERNPKRIVVLDTDHIEDWWNNLSPGERLELTSTPHIADYHPDEASYPRTSKEWNELTPAEEDWIIQMGVRYLDAEAEDIAMERAMEDAKMNPGLLPPKPNSAYVVTNETILSIVYGIEKWGKEFFSNVIEAKTPTDLGNYMFKINREAVNCRYEENEPAPKFKPRKNAKYSIPQVIKSIDCYGYQCSECDTTTKYWALFDALERFKCHLREMFLDTDEGFTKLYEKAEWDMEDKKENPPFKTKSCTDMACPKRDTLDCCEATTNPPMEMCKKCGFQTDSTAKMYSHIEKHFGDGDFNIDPRDMPLDDDYPDFIDKLYLEWTHSGNPKSTNWVRDDKFFKTVILIDPNDKFTEEATKRAISDVFPQGGVGIAPYEKTGLKGVEISVPVDLLPQDEAKRKLNYVEFEKTIDKHRENIVPKDYVFEPPAKNTGCGCGK